ncbi:MAG: hypothetical protein GX295_04945 [Syntrophomonadaceae bacterium]|nr:hypothetical protein [Syntrophomonadaceae bacterium]
MALSFKRNLSNQDRIIRISASLLLLGVLGAASLLTISHTWSVLLMVIAILLLVEGILGY